MNFEGVSVCVLSTGFDLMGFTDVGANLNNLGTGAGNQMKLG
jgi:hypothetical protein